MEFGVLLLFFFRAASAALPCAEVNIFRFGSRIDLRHPKGCQLRV